MTDDFASHGFELVTDEEGNELVKLMFMDENNESSGFALVSPEDAKKIMNGEATLQNIVDEDGKQVLTLVPVEQDQLVLQGTEDDGDHANLEQIQVPTAEVPSKVSDTNVAPSETITMEVERVDDTQSEKPVEPTILEQSVTADQNESGERFTITEQPAIVDGEQVQLVSLLDNTGNILAQKHGVHGSQILFELSGQPFCYEIQGPSETGEPITSTLMFTDEPTPSQSMDTTTANESNQQQHWPSTEMIKQSETEAPPGQQFTLTEMSVILNGKNTQTVILEDDKKNVIDQKYGQYGDHVIIDLNGQTIDYSFMGPNEDGQPIQTVLVVTNDTGEDSEAGLTAANWCPPGLSLDLYTSVRRNAEAIYHERLINRTDLILPLPGSDLFNSKKGYADIQAALELARSYTPGASQGETLEKYELLRNHAKIYHCGPQARPLTVSEMVVNEGASQLCRFKPELIFHKRELFHLAQLITQACSQEIKAAQASYHPQQHQVHQNSQMLHAPQPETAVVSGQVASTQLAMLESRGLTAIQPSHGSGGASLIGTAVPFSSDTGVVLAYTAKDASLEAAKNRQSLNLSNVQNYVSNMAVVKRDLIHKLSAAESEALRLAAVNALTDLPLTIDMKPKSDCTNIERASWERASELLALRSESAMGTNDPHAIASLLVNDTTRVDSVRDIAALYGRTPLQGGQQQQQVGLMTSTYPGSQLSGQNRSILTSYETACNEAAAYLAAGQPALLTRRRELAELARKVVRNCGCQFPHAPSSDRGCFAVDQVMELDLSVAEQLLNDPLERLDLSADTAGSESDEALSLDLSCEEHNVLNEISIFSVTGADTLKKVRILSLPSCSFTGIVPVHLNQCINLVELDLSDNYLHAFPRCLYLPKLEKLNLSKNPLLVKFANVEGPPLIEQFPKLTSVALDPEIKAMLRPQALAYLCPNLKCINGEDFDVTVTEETIKIAQAVKQELAGLVHSKWEDDLVEFFKKSVPHRDLILVTETLVAHAVNQCSSVEEPFKYCKAALARQIAEEFLAPKVVDDEDDEENLFREIDTHVEESVSTAPVPAPTTEANAITTEETSATTEASKLPAATDLTEQQPQQATPAEESTPTEKVAEGDITGQVASASSAPKAEKRDEKKDPEAEREAVAAAHNMTLLPDEPLDRLSGIIGTAMQHGKTVVYSVIRSAARQPNGDLIIPVVGGSMANGFESRGEDGYEQSDNENNAPVPTLAPKQTTHRRTAVGGARAVPTGAALLGQRRAGLMMANTGRAYTGLIKQRTATVASRRHEEEYAMANVITTQIYSNYGDLDDQADQMVTPKPVKQPGTWQPGKRGRPPASFSQKKAQAQKEDKETAELLQNVKIPPPHAPPPATLRMSTRDSNRMKRFSAYGAIDTAAALAGQEEALMVAAIAQEDEETEGIFSSRAKDDDFEASIHLTKRQRRSTEIGDEAEHILRAEANTSTIPTPGRRGRKPKPKPVTSVTVSTIASLEEVIEGEKDLEDEATIHKIINISVKADSVPPVPSLVQLGRIVDYDPLHFIRCHARDNDPLDCSTKVWRCALEPDPSDSKKTTSIVATCGGECVCLIDCQTGKVLKRFKHNGEEFYSVAWTTVEMATGHKTNLLAAAGKLKEIRLLHPERLVCYAEMKGHKEEIACMVFHPSKSTILFSGDSKACVCVWDIGVPSAPDYRTRHHLLMRLVCPRPHLNPVLNLIFMPNYDTILAGCEDGVFAWTVQDFKKQRFVEDRLPTMEIKIPTNREPCFDGLARLSENLVVVKCVEEGEIYAFDFGQVLLNRRGSTAAKGVVTAEILGKLRWQTTDEIYINVTARPGLGAVVCGDNEGTIWLYDLQQHIVNEGSNQKFNVKPNKILEWPECSVGGTREEDIQMKDTINSGFKNPVVNSTDISSDGKYLVAVTDNNLVCIWNFSG